MTSRSMIGYEKEDGLIVFVYCHELGYPNYQLSLLISEYMDRNKVIELVGKGSMRELKENIDEISFYKDSHNEVVDIGVCFSPNAYQAKMEKHGCDYCYYLNKDGEWKYFENQW